MRINKNIPTQFYYESFVSITLFVGHFLDMIKSLL